MFNSRSQCPICQELFVSLAEVSVLICGHTFHQHCILQWLERSKTCPSCRTKTSEKTLVKQLYFDTIIAENDGETNDNENGQVEVENKLRNELLEAQTRLSAEKLVSLKTKETIEKKDKEYKRLLEENKKVRQSLNDKSCSTRALQERISALELNEWNAETLKAQVTSLKERLKKCEVYDRLLTCSQNDADRAINGYKSKNVDEDLTKILSLLKRQYDQACKEKSYLSDKVRSLDSEKRRLEHDNDRLKRLVVELREEVKVGRSSKFTPYNPNLRQVFADSPDTSISDFDYLTPTTAKNVIESAQRAMKRTKKPLSNNQNVQHSVPPFSLDDTTDDIPTTSKGDNSSVKSSISTIEPPIVKLPGGSKMSKVSSGFVPSDGFGGRTKPVDMMSHSKMKRPTLKRTISSSHAAKKSAKIEGVRRISTFFPRNPQIEKPDSVDSMIFLD